MLTAMESCCWLLTQLPLDLQIDDLVAKREYKEALELVVGACGPHYELLFFFVILSLYNLFLFLILTNRNA